MANAIREFSCDGDPNSSEIEISYSFIENQVRVLMPLALPPTVFS